ncbi:MAG: hypothetical protein LBT00_10870 [Spirochaetaceae bacterium]|nr:hypothetical protein [Spirochaetaceae bacterium]
MPLWIASPFSLRNDGYATRLTMTIPTVIADGLPVIASEAKQSRTLCPSGLLHPSHFAMTALPRITQKRHFPFSILHYPFA